MALLPVVPVRPPSVVDTFTTFVTIDGRARRILARDPDPSLLRDPGDGLGAMLILPSYGMQALHLYMAERGVHLQTTGRGRSLTQQTNLFLSRMTPTYDPAVNTTADSRVVVLDQRGIHPDLIPGRRWYKRHGVAACASPATSNHGFRTADDVSEEYDGDAATDPIRQSTIQLLIQCAHLLGFTWELQSEPWHLSWMAGDFLPPLAQAVLRKHGIPFPGGTVIGSSFQFEDKRLFDSRHEGKKVSGQRVMPMFGLPANVVGVKLNVTVTETDGDGFVAVWTDGEHPGTSVQNWAGRNVTIAGSKDVALTATDTFELMVAGAGAHVVIDVAGYWLNTDPA